MAERARVRVPLRLRRAGLDRSPGRRLRCAVLAATAEEWAGVDIASGGFVRSRPLRGGAGGEGWEQGWEPLDVALVEVGEDPEPPDPARPEGIAFAGAPELVGRLARGSRRRLLRQLSTPEARGASVLGSRGPSIAYVECDLTAPSLTLLAVSPRVLRCHLDESGRLRCEFSWSGIRNSLPLLDPRVLRVLADAPDQSSLDAAALARAVGGKPGYLLVGLTAVRDGHAPKAVLSVLAR